MGASNYLEKDVYNQFYLKFKEDEINNGQKNLINEILEIQGLRKERKYFLKKLNEQNNKIDFLERKIKLINEKTSINILHLNEKDKENIKIIEKLKIHIDLKNQEINSLIEKFEVL